eukprot:TRINITY_DN6022_c1_g2_i1.p1 TRINITY_DN6022_c1_g2~~TRINITY_DN6022_c1_g2_i1.p1  ORF type:complete len:192 (-),score=62.96 TRINITY_DN6022_c1_g2_i1:7-582(-)
MFVPIRPGCRGGKDQFTWEQVKSDKYKEFYLGHSVNAVKATFNNPQPNAGWYMSKSSLREEQERAVEVLMQKKKEKDILNQALGITPKKPVVASKKLDKFEIISLTKKNSSEPASRFDLERQSGLGAGMSARALTSINDAPSQLISNPNGDEQLFSLSNNIEKFSIQNYEIKREKRKDKKKKKGNKQKNGV